MYQVSVVASQETKMQRVVLPQGVVVEQGKQENTQIMMPQGRSHKWDKHQVQPEAERALETPHKPVKALCRAYSRGQPATTPPPELPERMYLTSFPSAPGRVAKATSALSVHLYHICQPLHGSWEPASYHILKETHARPLAKE